MADELYYLAGDYTPSSSSGGGGDVSSSEVVEAVSLSEDAPTGPRMAWIPADSEHSFFSENGQWEKMSNKYKIIYNAPDHNGFDGQSNPTEAEAGSIVTIKYFEPSFSSKGEYIGWIPTKKDTGITFDQKDSLNDIKEVDAGTASAQFSFVMPSEDVTVYEVCGGGSHSR